MKRTIWIACVLLMVLSGCRRQAPPLLFAAVESGNLPGMEAALSAGAPVNQWNAGGLTPLMVAARLGNVPAVKLLLRYHADPDLCGGVNHWTPLMHAIHKNQAAAAQALLEGGAQVDARGRNGETALMMAAGYGYTPIVELLLDRGADPRAKTLDGANVLSIAAAGVPDIDRFTVGSCQWATIQVLKRRYPDLSFPDNVWGGMAKASLAVAKLRGCPY